jgi:hypothetical protein
MRTIFTSFALAAILACQHALALTLTQAEKTPTIPTPIVPQRLAQTGTAIETGADV